MGRRSRETRRLVGGSAAALAAIGVLMVGKPVYDETPRVTDDKGSQAIDRVAKRLVGVAQQSAAFEQVKMYDNNRHESRLEQTCTRPAPNGSIEVTRFVNLGVAYKTGFGSSKLFSKNPGPETATEITIHNGPETRSGVKGEYWAELQKTHDGWALNTDDGLQGKHYAYGENSQYDAAFKERMNDEQLQDALRKVESVFEASLDPADCGGTKPSYSLQP